MYDRLPTAEGTGAWRGEWALPVADPRLTRPAPPRGRAVPGPAGPTRPGPTQPRALPPRRDTTGLTRENALQQNMSRVPFETDSNLVASIQTGGLKIVTVTVKVT